LVKQDRVTTSKEHRVTNKPGVARRSWKPAPLQTILEIQAAAERFALATRATTDGVFDVDFTLGKVYYSARWRAILGLSHEEAFGKLGDWLRRVHPRDRPEIRSIMEQATRANATSLEGEFRCRHEDGSWRWLMVRAICQRAKNGKLLRITGSACDITARRVVDPLTGLHNRHSLLDNLRWRIDSKSPENRKYAVLFVDIDFFKRINDCLGHNVGDGVLIEVARRLRQSVHSVPGCVVSRLGGDEFVVLVSDLASEEDALTFASCLEYLLKNPIVCDGQQVFISASIGVAFGHEGLYRAPEQILEDADVAMYRAKMEGRARSTMFSQTMRQNALARLQLENDLRIALIEGQFELHYQPKVRLPSRQIKGFEALLRWRHPVRGSISPAEFIPVAEETGLISQIGRWATGAAIAQLASWRAAGIVTAEMTMAVNISARQLHEPDLLCHILQHLTQGDVPPQCLILEITESVLMEDSPGAVHLLDRIVQCGIGLDLDDFGTGYSSLSYLHSFPFRSVKIDRSFVGRMSVDPKSVSLVSAIVALAGSLRMQVIAEGVETEQQVAHLLEMGCTIAQGYLFSPPRGHREIEILLGEEAKGAVGVCHSTEDNQELLHSIAV
jgi:diguanylate cyclase (GGDEF)-like protein/PAS domain S-box-containing protein